MRLCQLSEESRETVTLHVSIGSERICVAELPSPTSGNRSLGLPGIARVMRSCGSADSAWSAWMAGSFPARRSWHTTTPTASGAGGRNAAMAGGGSVVFTTARSNRGSAAPSDPRHYQGIWRLVWRRPICAAWLVPPVQIITPSSIIATTSFTPQLLRKYLSASRIAWVPALPPNSNGFSF